MNTPKYDATECKWSTCSHIMNEPREVVTAAKPTKEWNNATVYGNSVTATVLPIWRPTDPPTPINIKAYIINGAGKFIEAIVVTTPPVTPVRPKTLPILEVDYEANPQIAPIQHTDEAR